MNRILIVAVIACVILIVAAILIAPTIDLQPSALRAQQWLSLIAFMFSLAGLFAICLQIVMAPIVIGRPVYTGDTPHQVSSPDLSCCLLC